jgi:hypothetical protein
MVGDTTASYGRQILPGIERDQRHRISLHGTEPSARYSSEMTIHLSSISLENELGQSVALIDGSENVMILLLSEGLLLMPGLEQRITRRREALPSEYRLIVVLGHPCGIVPGALIDREGQIRKLVDEAALPLLISIDANGSMIDIMRERDTIHDWLWNEPRPRSMRVHGAVGLGDVSI